MRKALLTLHREVRWLAQGHTASKQEVEDTRQLALWELLRATHPASAAQHKHPGVPLGPPSSPQPVLMTKLHPEGEPQGMLLAGKVGTGRGRGASSEGSAPGLNVKSAISSDLGCFWLGYPSEWERWSLPVNRLHWEVHAVLTELVTIRIASRDRGREEKGPGGRSGALWEPMPTPEVVSCGVHPPLRDFHWSPVHTLKGWMLRTSPEPQVWVVVMETWTDGLR